MVKWTFDQSSKTTAIFNKLNGKYKDEAVQKVYSGPQLSYEKAKGILESIKARQEKESKGSLESIANSSDYLVGVACVAAFVMAMHGVPLPYTPPAL